MHSKAAKLILESGILTEIDEAMEKSLFDQWKQKLADGCVVDMTGFAAQACAITEAIATLKSAIQMYTDTEGKDVE